MNREVFDTNFYLINKKKKIELCTGTIKNYYNKRKKNKRTKRSEP